MRQCLRLTFTLGFLRKKRDGDSVWVCELFVGGRGRGEGWSELLTAAWQAKSPGCQKCRVRPGADIHGPSFLAGYTSYGMLCGVFALICLENENI